MAKFGARHPVFAPILTEPENALPTYGVGAVIGKLVAANLTVNLASGELYADDGLAEQLSEFASGALAMETDDMTDEVASMVYGAVVANGETAYNKEDTAPLGGLGYYKVLMRNGVKYYKGCYYPKVRAALGSDNAQTRGNAITFTTENTSFTVFAPDNGDWRYTKTFTDEASARAWVRGKLGLGTAYEVNITTQGAGSVSPDGFKMVASGGSLELVITGTATKLYDNAEDKTASIVGGKYTLSNVTADHDIAIIF